MEEKNNQNLEILADFINATINSQNTSDIYIREAIIYYMNKSLQRGTSFEVARQQLAQAKLNINKAFNAIAKFDQSQFEMEFIHPSKTCEKVSELAIEKMIANHNNKSSEERMQESLKDFYGDNLSVTDEEKETLDAKLYPKFTLEKSVPSEPEESTYITVQDVAEYLQISEQGVRKHIKIGNLKAKQIGKLYRIKESDFSEFLAKRGTRK